MLRQLTWPQLMEWRAFEQEHPFDDAMNNWTQASLCCMMSNLFIASRGGDKRFDVKDFLLTFGKKKVEDVEDKKSAALSNSQRMKAMAQEMAALTNAGMKKKRKRR